MNTILAVDIGTSSTRARLYRTDDLSPVPGVVHQIAHVPDSTPDGGSTLQPEALVRETVACCRAVLDLAPPHTKIDAVATCCFWHSIVGVDSERVPSTDVLLWSDRRSAENAKQLRTALPDAPDRTGCPWHTSYVPPRIAWLAETQPATVQSTAWFLSPAAFLLDRLFGPQNAVESTSMASASGLWDQTTQSWDNTVVAQVGITPNRLPNIDDKPRTGLAYPFRALIPELAETPWFPAIGDGAASNLGCGASTPGKIAMMIGTSGALRTVVAGDTTPARPDGLWRYQIGPGRFLLGGALTNGGSVWAWLEQNLRLAPEHLTQMAAMPPDSHGLTILPFLAGERAPLWRDNLKSAVIGIDASTTPAHIARASLEAVAYRFAAIREPLRQSTPDATLIGTGAALLASPAWQQILCDVLGETIDISSEEEASARGAALYAREQLGLGNAADAPIPGVIARREPDAKAHAVYQAARERHEQLFQLVNGE